MTVVVIDTNILIAGILKDHIVRHILLSKNIKFVIPEDAIQEVERNKADIIEKSGLSKEEFESLFKVILKNITILPHTLVKSKIKDAIDIVRDIHINDAPFIAAALVVENEGLWSFDEHLKKQKKVKILTTREVNKFIYFFSHSTSAGSSS